jgi:hypothetical protein
MTIANSGCISTAACYARDEEVIMAVAGFGEPATLICEALGLKRVRCLDIHIHMDELITVTAEVLTESHEIERIACILKDYRAEEKVRVPQSCTCTTQVLLASGCQCGSLGQ